MTIKQFKKLKEDDKILFKGKEYWIIYDLKNETDVPLCTKEQFESFRIGDAHISWTDTESKIVSYGTIIGTIKDIKESK